MAIKGLLSKEINEELLSFVFYGILTWLFLTTVKWFGLIALDFNMVLPTMLVDWMVTAMVVFGTAMVVEYAEDRARIDIDKWDKTEQYTALFMALLFYPIMWFWSLGGAWILPVSLTFQSVETTLGGIALMTFFAVITGIVSTYLALKTS